MVGLHRAGPVHHVEAQLADPGHVRGHDLVAALGHRRHVGPAPGRRHADTEKPDAERTRHLAQLRKMRHQLVAGLMHVLKRRSGKFELSAGLERHGAAPRHVRKPDDVLAFHDRLPAEHVLHAVEQGSDAARPRVWHGPVTVERERKFLVFGADPKLLFRLATGRKPRDEFVARFDRCHIDLVTSHSDIRQGPRP